MSKSQLSALDFGVEDYADSNTSSRSNEEV